MASESISKAETLKTNSGSNERNENDSRTGSSVWNICPLPSDAHTVDLRDITPSISPVFTDDQVRELSGQTSDLDVLGDNFLPHDAFKRITEVLSPEQTNLLISTCSTLCAESEVLSYSDPVLNVLGQYSSPLKHGNDPMLNSQDEISEGMNPLLGNLNEKEKSKQVVMSTSTTVVSSSAGVVTTASAKQNKKDEETKSEEVKEKDDKDTTKENGPEVKDSKENKKSGNVRSSYSLRSSPRKPIKGQEIETSPVRNTRLRAKKESPSDADRRKSPRGSQKQQQMEKDNSTQAGKDGKDGRGGKRKNETPTLESENSKKEDDKKEERRSLRRSTRIQRKDTSPAQSVVQSPRKGRGGNKKATTAAEEEQIETADEKKEEKDEESAEKPATDKPSDVQDSTASEVKEEEEVELEGSAEKDDKAPKEEKEATIKEEEKEEKIYQQSLSNDVQKLKPMNDEVKQILTEILVLDKEICNPSNNTENSTSVREEENTATEAVAPVEETKDSSEEGKEEKELQKKKPEKKRVSKKELTPSRRSNRISESIQKREIEAAVKKAQEEMLKEIEEQERKEREEEERKKREEDERKRKEEEEKQREENERKMKEEEEKKEKEKEQEEDSKETGIKKDIGKEKEKDKYKKEANKITEEHHKIKDKPTDHKSKEKLEKGHIKSTDEKVPHSPTHHKKQHAEKESSDEKQEGMPLFAVGIDHEVYSKVKHKRHPSEEEKPSKVKRSRTSEHSKDGSHTDDDSGEATTKSKESKESVTSSDEEANDSGEEFMEEDSDYDPEYDPERLWCICRKPHGNRFMICCDNCEEWLHGDCVSITKEIGKEMEKNGIEYVCPRCVIAKKKLKAQGGNAVDNSSKATDDSSNTPKRPRRHRRLKMPREPGEKRHHRHSTDSASKTRKSESKGQEKRSKDSGHKDHSSDIRRRNSDPSSYKIPKKVRTTPTPASFASKAQRKCINTGCQNHAEHNSVYCSDSCIAKHADESINLLNEERKKRIGHSSHGSKTTTSPTSSINMPNPWESSHTTATPQSPQSKERVAVIERMTGRLIAGVAAPAEQDLVHWLKRHPTFEVIKPSVSKEVKRKDRKEEEKAIRDNVKRSLKEILSGRMKEAPELKLTIDDVNKMSNNIEEDLYKYFGDAGPRYKSKYRSLAFNLKDFRNKVLFHHVLSGEVPTDKLVGMTAEQLANKELARWRERETKHTLEMIKQNQEDINPTKGHIKKTHKGEIELDEDEDLSTLEVHAVNKQTKEKSEVTEADSNTSPGPLLVDTTDQHRIHLFDLNCRICTGKMQPPGEPPRQEDTLMLVSTSTPIQALAESSVPSPPPLSMDIASVSSTESFSLGSVSPPPNVKPVRRDKPVWKGFVMMQSVAKFGTNAFRVSGPCDDLLQLLPDTLHLQGRIGFEQVWDYIYQLRSSTTRDVSVIRYEASSDEEKTSYVSLYSYFYSRKRCGVVNNCYTGVKDMYLMPLASHSPIPNELLPFDGPGLEEPRPHMLLGLIVRNKPHFKRPRPLHHKPTSSPPAKRRHSNTNRSNEEILAKDSPPDVEDIVFQYAHNRKTSSDSKPDASPSSGSSSTLSSPSIVTPSISGSTDASLDSSSQKTSQEELHKLEARAKQYMASALQPSSKTEEKDNTKTAEESKLNDDDDKPYDPEEDFDLDLELEKPIDAKKSISVNTPTVTANVAAANAVEVSSSAGVSATPTSDAKSVQQSTVQNILLASSSAPAAQVSNIPLITPAVSTGQETSVPSLPLSIFMPMTSTPSGTLLTSTAKPLATQPVSLPAVADLAGIVKLIGATLKQNTVPGQATTGDAQNTQTTTAQGATTGTVQGAGTSTARDPKHDYPKGSSGPHRDTQYRGSDGKADTSHSSSAPEVSGRPSRGPHHDEGSEHKDRSAPGGNYSVADRQRIDRERLEWRERRYSRDGPRDQRGHRDVGPQDDRWRDQRDPRGPPIRRPSDDRYQSHGDQYGPHRGDHQDRGRYNPSHRGDDRRDRRENRRSDPRNSDRWRERWRR
ncbi:PHD finger protein 3-like [Actinia tenebrosa]|uniref:PHD finger protein 3-like n=1 Tax=Actinia tenebrosa TaxID=6105 RepID=A0A6P8I3H0_ACTTE|nr:PHD finger protein 3-like [Actinia tenebrosa]